MARTVIENLGDVVQSWASTHTDRTAFTFLADGERDEQNVSYGELDRRARCIAAKLQAVVAPGDRVLLLFPPGLEFIEAFYGCLYAGVIAVPAYPPDPSAPQHIARIDAIARDCRPSAILSIQLVADARGLVFGHAPALADLPIVTSQAAGPGESEFAPLDIGPLDLAFLQYTSGSTGTPRGVVLTHGNLLHNEEMIRAAMPQDSDAVLLGWLPLFHDMGLIGLVNYTAYIGARCVLMGPEQFLRRPMRWLEAASRYRATLTGAPNFGFELCVRKSTPEQRAALDLSSIEILFNGAEPVRADTIERFAAAFAPSGLRVETFTPCYGLAEATLIVTSSPPGVAPRIRALDPAALEAGIAREQSGDVSRPYVSCGVVAGEQAIAIVDPATGIPCPGGRTGEVWVRGPHVGQGYWGRPEETEETFRARLAGDDRSWLRSGDLGVLLEDDLYVVGRLKDLLIVRGRNLAPQDLERVAEQSDMGLRSGCSAVVQLDGPQHAGALVFVLEFDAARGSSPEQAITAVREAVAHEFGVELHAVVLIAPRTIPKTSSGKIQRRACRIAYEQGTLREVVGSWSTPEHADGGLLERVTAFVTALLDDASGTDAGPVAPTDRIDALGVDSLLAAEIRSELERQFGVAVSLRELLQGLSIEEIAHRVGVAIERDAAAAPQLMREDASRFGLSDGQLGLWFLQEREPASCAYNVPVALRIRSGLDGEAFRGAIDGLVERHEALRTRFDEVGGVPLQEVLDARPADVELLDAAGWDEDRLAATMADEAHRPFDLRSDPLLRVRVWTVHETDHRVLLVLHHIVTDFWSLAVLADELGQLYRALVDGARADLGEPAARYADFVRRQSQQLGTPAARQDLEWWARVFDPPPAPLELPTDRPRPPVQTERGSSCSRRLPARAAKRLREVAQRADVSLYTVLLAGYQTLLHRYSGQDDIVVGSPTSGRDRAELGGILGYFVNTVALRQDIGGNPRFTDLLARTRATVLDALERQHVPFMRVVERAQPPRDASRSALFQAMLVHQQAPLRGAGRAGLARFALGEAGPAVDLDGLEIEPLALARRSAQFDVLMMSAESADGLDLSLQYNADLFDADTAQRMLGHFATLLESIADDPSRPLAELPMLTGDELRQLAAWNATDRELGGPWIHEEVAARAAQQPEEIALVLEGAALSYGELDARANQLAHHLRAAGVGRGSYVGIALERSFELLVGVLGTLKSGATYVPLDPEYPRDRLADMLEDAAPDVVLTLERLAGALPETQAHVLRLDADWDAVADSPNTPPSVAVAGDDAAYLIFTSGSTGRPKGVVNTHAAIANRLAWMQAEYRCGADDRVMQKTPVSFDVSVWELFWPLIAGSRIILARPGGHRDAAYLIDLVEREGVTTMHFVPSMLQLFLAEPGHVRCHSLRRVICSGEALPADLVRRFFARLDCELHNLYGPTEAAVDVTSWACSRDDERGVVPIGHPIANTQIHLLGPHGELLPIGVPGELHIGGVGVARGYLNRPELTAERFVADPYSTVPGARLYRTGDLARRLPDGSVDYRARLDSQVKLHGNRIELGEIEARLAADPQIREAVVTVRGTVGDQRLVAYVTRAGGRQLDEDALRESARRYLPVYMVPSQFVELAELPLTPSGKVDRGALPEPSGAVARGAGALIGPRTPVERTLARVVCEVLALDEVGVHDNFFTIGGDSIRTLQLRVRARQAGLELDVADVFQHQTIEAMARAARAVDPAHEEDRAAPVAPFELVGAQDRERMPGDVVDAFPLAQLQAGLVFHSEMSPDYETYVMGLHLGGCFAEDAMREALARLVARHPLLRTSFHLEDYTDALQLVHETAVVALEVHDLGDLTAAEHEAEIERFMATERWRKFDWGAAPLLRLAVHRRGDDAFQCTLSHPLFDGWSMAVLVTELLDTYAALARGEDPAPAPGPRLTYADFVALERKAMASASERAFWAERLAGASRGELPRWPSRRHPAPSRHRRTSVAVETATRDGLQRLARRQGTSLKSVLLAAHLRVISVMSGRTDITTGTISNGRPEELDGDRIIGLFLNTTPLRMHLNGGTWRDLVRQTYHAERELLPHRRYPMAELVRTIGGGEALFDSAFNYIHFHIYESLMQVDGLEVRGWTNPSDQTYFPLTAYFHLDVASSQLLCFLDLDDAVFDPAQVETIRACYAATLCAMATNPDGRYEAEQLVPADKLSELLRAWNDTGRPWPAGRPRGVHRRVAEQAQRRPHAIAVRGGGRELTYEQLDRAANRLAHRLRRLGAAAGETVGIALGRSPDLLVALLAVLKTSAAYVPIDPGYPVERLRHMIEDSGAAIVVSDGSSAERLPAVTADVLRIDELRSQLEDEPATAPDAPIDPEALAYVIYTSGSTGLPKGVEIAHRGLDNLLLAMQERLGWRDDDGRLLSVTTLSFDIAALELFLPLSTGGIVELATEDEVGDPHRLMELLAGGATTMQATPATWRMLVHAGWEGSPSLRVVCGGEALPAELAEQLRPRCRELWNVYGPTEATIWSTAARLDDVDGMPPIGAPLANTQLHVLDPHGRHVPVGTPGELHIGGDGVARGYRNRPDLDARAFLPDPFAGVRRARMYRTGDLVRWRPDGLLEFLGRLDSQVKVRGFRVELGEIETVLERHDDVRQAVAAALEGTDGDAQLVAYVVPTPGTEPASAELRAAVAAVLPGYMVPSVVVTLDELPLTPNGKVDRGALPAPTGAAFGPHAAFAAPQSELEQRLAAIWEAFLPVDRVGIDDGFFDVGGHSLLMVRVQSRIRREIQEVSLMTLFEHSTIRRLAEFMDGGAQSRPGADEPSAQPVDRRGWAHRRRARRTAGGRS